jgi:hypothetical protein
MIHAYGQYTGVDIQLANNGDDCVVFMERSDLETFMAPLPQWFLSMGFNMTVEPPVYDFCELEFCQTKPIFDGQEWIMCRNVSTAIVKDSVMLKNWDSASLYEGWLDAVGTGGLALAGQLPIFQELYQLYVRSGKKTSGVHGSVAMVFPAIGRGCQPAVWVCSPRVSVLFLLRVRDHSR